MKYVVGIIKALLGYLISGLVETLKVEAATRYVAGVRKARRGFIALIGSFLLLLLMMSGFLLIHVALFMWLPWALPLKALLLLGLGLIYLLIGLLAVLAVCSERAWMKFTKVDQILAGLSKGSPARNRRL